MTSAVLHPTPALRRSGVARAAGRAVRLRCAAATVKVGDKLPDVMLTEGQPGYGKPVEVSLRSLFAGKRGILFAVPGAFTPGCSKSHLPSYIREHEKLKELGIDAVVCVATNDAYVMHAWGEQQGALGKVRLLADADAALATALGVAKPSGALVRSGRYSAVIVDNTVASFNDADAGGGSECTYADALLASLPAILAKAKDPLETFCESDPSADECRVYSD